MKKLRNALVATTIIFSSVATVLALPLNEAEAATDQRYSDVPTVYYAYDEIEALSEAGAINGYTDGTFKPHIAIKRIHFAKIFTLGLGIEHQTREEVDSSYKDVPANHPMVHYIEASKPFISGYEEDGMDYYEPFLFMNRSEAAAAFVKYLGLEPAQADLSYIEDYVDKERFPEELTPYIALAKEYGIMVGGRALDPTKAKFSYNGVLTRAEMAIVLMRVLEVEKTLNQ